MEFRCQADRDYANGAFIPGSDRLPGVWAERAAGYRQAMAGRARLGLAYGTAERQRFDLFLPDGAARGLMVFVHGGYWLEGGREIYSHLASGAVARGWACAIPSYTLAPEARIAAITADIRLAVRAAAALVPGPVVVTGHSAGGHLAARMGCADGPEGLARVVPISPLADLRPLLATSMNDRLRLDADEAEAESPCKHRLAPGVQAHVWVGGQERPAFLWQARVLSEDWGCGWTVDPGRHHFDVIDGLVQPDSALTEACLAGL